MLKQSIKKRKLPSGLAQQLFSENVISCNIQADLHAFHQEMKLRYINHMHHTDMVLSLQKGENSIMTHEMSHAKLYPKKLFNEHKYLSAYRYAK